MQYPNDYLIQRMLIDVRREVELQPPSVGPKPVTRRERRWLYPLLASLGRRMNALGQQLQARYAVPERSIMERQACEPGK